MKNGFSVIFLSEKATLIGRESRQHFLSDNTSKRQCGGTFDLHPVFSTSEFFLISCEQP